MKPVLDFGKDRGRKDGMQRLCKACCSVKARQHYLRHAEAVKERMRHRDKEAARAASMRWKQANPDAVAAQRVRERERRRERTESRSQVSWVRFAPCCACGQALVLMRQGRPSPECDACMCLRREQAAELRRLRAREAYWSDPVRGRDDSKKVGERQVKELRERYVVRTLLKGMTALTKEQLPQELIDLKRAQLRLMRELKGRSDENSERNDS